jgi:transaldolase
MSKPTQQLHDLGQSLWLDNLTRDMLTQGTLRRYIDDFSVSGLTSNPTIFAHAVKGSSAYDGVVRKRRVRGKTAEEIFLEFAIDDIRAAADLFRTLHERTCGVDGFVSLEVSPLLAYDTATTLEQAKDLHKRVRRPNVYIKIPGTREGVPAIEEAIFAGIPINVTLLFSREQYLAAADAYLRGIERRIAAGRSSDVPSVASIFVSRWDVAVAGKVAASLVNRLGVAIARRTYAAYREFIASQRFQRVQNEGARPQRLLFASTGTKDPHASDVLYIEALGAPLTINTMPDATLKAFAGHGRVGAPIAADGGECEEILGEFEAAGIDLDGLAATLQKEGAEAFSRSWNELMDVIAEKSAVVEATT